MNRTAEASLGVMAFALATGLVRAVLHAHSELPPSGVQTLSPSAPPSALGSRFDDDHALPARAAPVASYELSATLDPALHTVRARGVIRWQNASSAAVDELWMHLYLNAFKNDQSLFLRSPFGAGRTAAHARDWGYVDVTRLSARELGGTDLWPLAAKYSPTPPSDQTDIRVALPKLVGPGESLTLDVEFVAKLPEIVERTGYSGSFHFVGQWFPKLARLEPNGTWAHFPFDSQSEFYADYGDYRVDIDTPENFVVGATGVRTKDVRERGRRVVRYEAQNVHDFAWTAWDRFEEYDERIDGVAVRLLHPPGYEAARASTLDALRFALPYFSRHYGRYPYPTLTVVHPPASAEPAGGMEYPTLITTGSAWYLPFTGVRALEAVTVHELGHQWFYGLVASDEHSWPFLDEGLNSYAELDALEAKYGSGSLFDRFGLTLSAESGHRALAATKAEDDPVASPAARFENFGALGALVYSRTATILRTFAKVYGEAKLERALGRYARYYRYAHPAPRHFVAAVREELGEEAAEQLELALFERGTVDYAVSDVATTKLSKPAGVFDRAKGRETVIREEPAEPDWLGRVSVHRRGSLRFPVDVELVAEDGTRERRRWDGRGTWTAFEYRGKSRLIGAVVDPEFRVLLDGDLLNNAASDGATSAPRLLERATYWAELALTVFGP